MTPDCLFNDFKELISFRFSKGGILSGGQETSDTPVTLTRQGVQHVSRKSLKPHEQSLVVVPQNGSVSTKSVVSRFNKAYGFPVASQNIFTRNSNMPELEDRHELRVHRTLLQEFTRSVNPYQSVSHIRSSTLEPKRVQEVETRLFEKNSDQQTLRLAGNQSFRIKTNGINHKKPALGVFRTTATNLNGQIGGILAASSARSRALIKLPSSSRLGG